MGILGITFIGSPIDATIIIAYFIGIVIFGSFFGKFTKSTKDFFFGGQRFPWWLLTMSCVATLVGSYSFIKYSEAGYLYGMSSSMSYLNDWFIMPFFIFGWLPIIYFSRVISIPEYFERRFNRTARLLATILIMIYLIGYIGINFLTLGIALNKLLGVELYTAVIVIAILTAIYVTAGGQTAVIMTDLVQGFILLTAGLLLFVIGVMHVGGFGAFWDKLPVSHRLPFSGFQEPGAFPGVGIFWQDAIANSLAFYFMNQGLIMRFLSAKSLHEGRKAVLVMILILMPLTAIAVSSIGWVGKAMPQEEILQMEKQIALEVQEKTGETIAVPTQPNPKNIFVTVSRIICLPGVFGFIMAALIAALMSTVDTLINAASAIFVNDIWKSYIKPKQSDQHYLFTARWFSVAVAILGVALVPIFAMQESLYKAHGMFTAAVTPPMVVAILFGAFWKRYSGPAAVCTLFGGSVAIILSFVFPGIIGYEIAGIPLFSWGVGPAGADFMRAFYGLVICFGIGLISAYCFQPASSEQTLGYVSSSIHEAAERYKGGKLNTETTHVRVQGIIQITQISNEEISLSKRTMQEIGAQPGDLLYVTDIRWWLGGIRSSHFKAATPHEQDGLIRLSEQALDRANLLLDRPVFVEKIL